MAVTFAATRTLLSTMATTLSTEATSAGLSSLATGLTNLSTEILTTNSAITETEFITNGAGRTWADVINSAALIIGAKNINSIRDHFVANDSTKFWSNISNITSEIQNISNKTDSIASYQKIDVEKQTIIADKQTTIATNSATIAEKLTAIETYQKTLKELGEGEGIHMIGPYDWLGLISIYRLLVEQGAISEDEKGLTKSAKALNVEKLKTYLQKIKSLPTGY